MFKKTVLKNGLRIITFPMKNTKVVTLLLLVATGSKYEKKEVNGISHLVEHMFFKGTKKRPHTIDVVRELDRVGGLYNAFTGKEFMGFWVKLNANHFDLAADILSDMIFNSQFKTREIEKEKRVVIEEINMIKDNPQRYVLDLWEKLLYGNQPAGWLISGTKESVKRISRKDILDYFREQFSSTNAVISVAGNLRHEQAISKIKKFFGNFKRKKAGSKRETREFQNSPQVLLNFKRTDQSHLCLGVRTFDLFDPRRYPLALLSVILGGIMSSRLFIKVREKKGLAYYIRTSPQHYTDTGFLVTHTGIDNRRVEDAIKIILKEHRSLKRKKVSKKELKKAKENIKGRLYLSLETSDAWASFLGGKEILREEITTPEIECKRIDKVRQNDILRVANEIFQPEKLNLALTGPFKDKEKFQKLLRL
jgi:predicted Zn-dependent peptidase